MKICMVTADRVRIPTRTVSSFALDAVLRNPTASSVEFGIRELVLEPRELNGITRMVAYDPATDTLFIKEPPL